jgi:hypothetical protein
MFLFLKKHCTQGRIVTGLGHSHMCLCGPFPFKIKLYYDGIKKKKEYNLG